MLAWSSREEAADSVISCLEHFDKRPRWSDVGLMIDHAFEKNVCAMHAIARVLKTCCHCVDCERAARV